jgi:alkanesulfonate monooxygenase SsuD/methylene tetrahydromethanopterin reductase-like flavin-dependent oxidoreductase (luciferase family)
MQMLQISPVMGYAAAHAQGMTIGPNILILPPLNPMHVAEEAATLDVLTGGNYILGIGLGYRQPEFEAFGISLTERAPRFNEAITLMRRLWTRGSGDPQGPVLHSQPRRHRSEAGSPGWTTALYRRAGRRVGEARGADWRRAADMPDARYAGSCPKPDTRHAARWTPRDRLLDP